MASPTIIFQINIDTNNKMQMLFGMQHLYL